MRANAPIPLRLVTLLAPLAIAAACKKDAPSADAGAQAAAPAETAPASAAPVANAASGQTIGDNFEGEITMRTSSAARKAPPDVTFLTKGNKLLIDAPGPKGEKTHVIFETGAKKMTVVIDAQKMFMEMDVPNFQTAAHGGAPSAQAQVTKTGTHDRVAGYDCEIWDIKEPSGKRAQACIAQGIPFVDFANMGPPGSQGNTSPWMQELHDKRLFPLRVVEMDPEGKERSRMEVTKIEKKKLDDALFAVPAGYKKFEIPPIGGGAIPGLPPVRR